MLFKSLQLSDTTNENKNRIRQLKNTHTTDLEFSIISFYLLQPLCQTPSTAVSTELQFAIEFAHIEIVEVQPGDLREWFPLLEIHIAYWLRSWKMFIYSWNDHSLTEKTCHRNLLQALLNNDLSQPIPVWFNEWFALGQSLVQILWRQRVPPVLWDLHKQAACVRRIPLVKMITVP